MLKIKNNGLQRAVWRASPLCSRSTARVWLIGIYLILLKPPMSSENLAPRDAKVISVILRSLGIEECEPKVIVQLLEFAYKYSSDIFEDALLYAKLCERSTITGKDLKLALQTKIGKHFVPAPPRSFLQSTADQINIRPLSQADTENLIRAPNMKSGLFSMEYIPDERDGTVKKKKVYF